MKNNKIKLADFNNPKWTYNDLKQYARKYLTMLDKKGVIPVNISKALSMYQSRPKDILIQNLTLVQNYLYK